MTPEERTAAFVAKSTEMDTITARLVQLNNQIATRQVERDQITARFIELRRDARQLLPVAPEVPE